MSEYELVMKIRNMRELQALINQAEDEIEGIKNELKAAMGDAEELVAGEYKITWKSVPTTKLDTAALKMEMPEVAKKFSRKSACRRFCVV